MTDYTAVLTTAICSGIGSAIGQYLAFKYAIDHLEKIPLVKDKVKQWTQEGIEIEIQETTKKRKN